MSDSWHFNEIDRIKEDVNTLDIQDSEKSYLIFVLGILSSIESMLRETNKDWNYERIKREFIAGHTQ